MRSWWGGRRNAGKNEPATTSAGPAKVSRSTEPGKWSVAAENKLPGSTAWKLSNPAPLGALEGFANRVAVDSGESFDLHVNTTAKSFFVTAFRMGWYGGMRGRRVWQSSSVEGTKQADGILDEVTFTVRTEWPPSMTVDTTGWPEGSYLLKLVSSDGYDKWVPITVRSRSAVGKTVFVNATTTWLAYNLWGEHNVYGGPEGPGKGYHKRSRKVSLDRPYDKNGNYFSWYELPMLGLVEKMGLDLAYATDHDLHADRDRLEGAAALVFAGHDEYWTTGMMDNALWLRDQGTNLAFFGANTAYRHVRFEDSPIGKDRIMACYKSDPDPIAETDPKEATRQWRQDPNYDAESILTGVLYEGNGILEPFVVTEPDAWMFKGTKVKKGEGIPNLIDVEYDKLIEGMPVPRPLQVLAESPVVCRKAQTYAHACYYTVPSGAGVFASGTLGWSVSLPEAARAKRNGQRTAEFVERVSRNILQVFSEGPAGNKYPAQDNYDQYVRPLATDMKYDYDL